MGESHSGYRVPPSQMEDVPIDNRHSENAAKSRLQYVKSNGKPKPCLDVMNHWDFFKHYKASVFTAIISMVALLLFSAAMIYMSLQPTDGFYALPIKTMSEVESVTEKQFFTKQDAEDIDGRDNTVRQYLYEIRKIRKRDAPRLVKRNVENTRASKKSFPREEPPRDAEIISHNPEFSKEFFDKDTGEQRINDKREIEKRQKMTACQKKIEHCKSVLESMQSLAKTAGENVDSLSKLVKQIRLNEGNSNQDPRIQDFLQCIECGQMTVNDSIALIDSDSDDYHQQHSHHHHHHHSQMKNMSAVSALLDNSNSASEESQEKSRDQDTKSQNNKDSRKSSVTSTITQKSGSNIQKTVEVSKSKKLTDDAEITQIIKNTTIIKTPDGKIEKETQESQMSSGNAVQSETSTATGLNFDSLLPLRPRPTMQVVNGVNDPIGPPVNPSMSGFEVSSGWAENHRTGLMTEEPPVVSTVAQAEPRFFQGPSGEGVSMDSLQPRIITGTQFQPSKSNSDGNSMIMPTAETMKSGQQVQYTPWMPYSVCYFGSPPGGAPSGPFKQTMPGTMNFPASSPGAANFPGNQYPVRGSGFSSQGFVPMPFQQHQGVPFGPMPQFQQGNMAAGFQQNHRVGPSGPGTQNFIPNFGNTPTGPGAAARTPYFCTYGPGPTFQFPTVPGVSEFQRFADSRTDVVEGSAKQYGIQEPVWNGDMSNYPGYPGDCDQNSHRCLDGSRCIPKNLWCDGSVDCPDASDETRCSCRDRITKDRICDGYFDCPRGEDELGCFGCPPNSFSCEDWSRRYRRDNCVPLSQRCDGLQQCSNGKDEMDCAILTETYIETQDAVTVGYTSGYLHKNWKGRWYPVCTRTTEWAIDACSSENDSPVRETPLIQIESTPIRQYHGPYLAQSESGEIKLVPTCFNKAIHVICPQIPCGTRVLSQESYSPFGAYEETLVASPRNQNVRPGDEGYFDTTNGNKEEIVGDTRVVGGRASQPKAWPFLVGIYKDGYFHCGGTIINNEWVLTAAHCVDGFRQHYYEIQAGLLRRFSFSPMAQIRRAMYIKMHPGYDRKIMKNDLALIRLNEPLRFNRWIRPTCLPKKSSYASYWRNGPYPDTTCVTIGWGATAERGPDPDHLREVEVPILRECKHLEDRNDAEICAGMPQGGRDACQGDSGGPLMCKYPESENQWYVAGIVSHGDGCARPNEPGAYTRVSRFVDWIEATTRIRAIPALEPKPVETCPGFSCAGGLGKCLPRSKRCDRVVNCLDAEDEVNCPILYKGYPPFREAANVGNEQESNNPDGEIAEHVTMSFQETEKATNRVNATTSEGTAKHSVFTIDDEENSTTSDKTDSIATSSPPTQKNITDATSASGSSSEQPIITTSKPQSSSQQTNEINYVPRFTCTKILQSISISKRCNRVLDCEDGTDEDNCTCKDYLANSHPVAICDGHVDCYDGSDEEGCAFCKEDEFVCSRSGKCISQTKLCDHHIDCPYMEDELDCFALTNGKYVIMDLDKRPHLNLQGVVTQRKNGKWRPACQKHNKTVQSRLSNEFCVYFGFGAAESIKEIPVQDTPIEVRQSTKDNIITYEYPPAYTKPDNFFKACLGLYVKCKPILSSNTSHLIATNPSNEHVSYLLPWQAHIFVDGRYHCPAILLENSWLLTSSRCAEDVDLKGNYTMALLGTAPTYLYVDGPYQQRAAIDSITILSKLDAAMMHLEYPVNMTRYVQPIFLQKKIFPATNKDLCIATGVDEKHHTKTTYLRPIPQNCPQCHRCYKNATYEECRNKTSANWSGTVVCRGSSIWYPAAIFHEKDLLCGFQSSQTLASIDYGYAHFTEVMEKELQTTTGPNCDGLRCALGKCIPWNKVCDGVDDCRDGTDENRKYCGKRREHCKATNGIGCQCTKSELRCANGQCVPKEAFCNSIHDCDDHSDEPATCNCAAYLKLTAPERICDNVRHCLDKSDESSEHCHCKDASFKCTSGMNVTESCVSQDFVCDGEEDCANGKDEKSCRIVKGTLKDLPGTGEVLRRSFGVWHSECFPMPLTTTKDISELCKTMGYDFGRKLEFENGEHPYGPPMVVQLDEFYMIRLNRNAWINTRANRPLVTLVAAKEPCHRAFVKCT